MRREEYINMFIKINFVQPRAGTLSLHIETGRYAGIQEDERLCCICINGNIEDEVNFLCLSCANAITLYMSLFKTPV